MNLSRRGFFKATGAALATTMAFELSSQTQAFASESKQDWKLVNTEEYTNICCYCAGGCWDTSENGAYAWVKKPGTPEFTTPMLTNPKKDMTLQDPMCVYQQFKKHYSRYTLDTVCGICGMDKDVLELVYKPIPLPPTPVRPAPCSTRSARPSTPMAPRTRVPCA